MSGERKNIIILSDSVGLSNSCARLLEDLRQELLLMDIKCHFNLVEETENNENSELIFREKQSMIMRGLSEISLALKLSWRVLATNGIEYNAVISYSPSIFLVFPAAIAKFKWRIPYYLILRDIVPQWLNQSGNLNKGLVYFLLLFVSYMNYRVADFIGVQSNTDLDFLRNIKKNNEGSKIHLLRNWRALDNLWAKSSGGNFKSDSSEIRILYAGNVGLAQKIDVIFNKLLNLNDIITVKIDVYGFGWELDSVIHSMQCHKYSDQISFHEPTNEKLLIEYSRYYDFGLVALNSELQTGNIPSKIILYLAGGLRILGFADDRSELKKLITSKKIGLFMDTGAFLRTKDKQSICQLLSIHIKNNQDNITTCLKEDFSSKNAALTIVKYLGL